MKRERRRGCGRMNERREGGGGGGGGWGKGGRGETRRRGRWLGGGRDGEAGTMRERSPGPRQTGDLRVATILVLMSESRE